MRRPSRSTYIQTKQELDRLYREYNYLRNLQSNRTFENIVRLNQLIDIISLVEYRLIQQIRDRHSSYETI